MTSTPRTVTTYWSMQSPYCYFALDRVLALEARPDVTVDLRPVRPGVLRTPERYRDRDALEQRYFDTDVQRSAAFLGLPFANPDPSPVAFMPGKWVAEAAQPRIGRLYDLLMAAAARGRALAFLDKVMRLIWDGRTPGWDRDDHLNAAIATAGMDPADLAADAEANRTALAERLAANEAAMLADGHWGGAAFRLGGRAVLWSGSPRPSAVEIGRASMTYTKPERWKDPANKLFPHQVGFTSPPHDFDAAPTDFLKIAPETVGVHGRMLHVPGYAHQLTQRVDNFGLLEEYVECMANNGADVCGQVGTNWVHAGGKTPDQIKDFLDRVADTYETPLHMAGYCLVEALRAMNIEKVALNSVYYWPDWRDGIARFLRDAGFDLIYVGNFVDLGFYQTQDEVNALTWIFPGDLAEQSCLRALERAPGAQAVVINGMPNFRRADGLPQRIVSLGAGIEERIGVPIISSDTALYWRIFKTLGTTPMGRRGRLLGSLQGA